MIKEQKNIQIWNLVKLLEIKMIEEKKNKMKTDNATFWNCLKQAAKYLYKLYIFMTVYRYFHKTYCMYQYEMIFRIPQLSN